MQERRAPHQHVQVLRCHGDLLKFARRHGHIYIKSRANILTRVQSKAYTEPSSFSSLFNLPYSKDIHYDGELYIV